jgi:diguanylate cyclase (GGDEF)-like protein
MQYMKALLLASATFMASVPVVWCAPPQPLTSLHAIHALTADEASHELPVAFEATVTYYRSFEPTLFVQDKGEALYVRSSKDLKLLPGDRVLITGSTYADFRPDVVSSKITVLRADSMPRPVATTFETLIKSKLDCTYVVVRGVVRSADVQLSAGHNVTQLELSMDSGYIGVTMDNGDAARLNGWLDSEVEITGVAAGRFDGKMQLAGILLHSSSYRDVHVLHSAARDPWSLPITPMDNVLTAYNVLDRTRRVRVQGTITYYHQAQMAVLQDGPRSIRVFTPEIEPLQIGDRAEAIGIPYVDNGFLTLKMGALRTSGAAAPIAPVPVTWDELASSKHAFDLVTIEGTVVTQVRESAQDVYVISAQGNLFSAVVRHPFVYEWGVVKLPPPMPPIPPGSKVRITGVAILDDGNPFNGAMAFGILLRSASDVAVIASPSWLNVRNLLRLVSLLLLAVIGVAGWSWILTKKVQRQTAALATRIEAEAILERRRSLILENINGTQPLGKIIQQITELVTYSLGGSPCWCEFDDGHCLGNKPVHLIGQKMMRQEIPSRSGAQHGVLYAALHSNATLRAEPSDALSMGAWLATLAIETRGLYSDLVHRSEYDLLTDVYNRFSLEKLLIALMEDSRQQLCVFGLIYIDLDDFKQVNDQYGHLVGDVYLQTAAARMKGQLRPVDTLARLGGDEFAALIPSVHGRADVEEIAQRLDRCFDEPIAVQGYTLQASASIGIALFPEDGQTGDNLLSAADAAMYVAKNIKKENRSTLRKH